jgi:hypothetical protein
LVRAEQRISRNLRRIYNSDLHATVQHSAVQHYTAQHYTAQHYAVQRLATFQKQTNVTNMNRSCTAISVSLQPQQPFKARQ